MHQVCVILFNHACRYELFDRNPMRLVRQGAKGRSAPNVLTAAEIGALVDHLPLRERTLVLLAAATGLRQSECSGSSGMMLTSRVGTQRHPFDRFPGRRPMQDRV
jgi:site-specific recombinase XerD